MLRTLRIEWMKLRHYRTFWILLAISVVSIPAVNYMLYDSMGNKFPKIKGQSILGSPFVFPDVWQTVSWNASLLFLIPAILIITLLTNEFGFKTHRQNIIDGWSRREFYHAKLAEILILSVCCTLTVILTCLAFGFGANGLPAGVSAWTNIRFAGFYFIQFLSYSMIAFLLSLLVKRAGLALGLFFIYLIAEEVVVDLLHKRYQVEWVTYLPEEVTDKLIPQPYLTKVLGRDMHDWQQHVPIYLVISAVYLVVYYILGSLYFKRRDL